MRFFVSDRILLSSLPIFPPSGFPLHLSPSLILCGSFLYCVLLSRQAAQIAPHIGDFLHPHPHHRCSVTSTNPSGCVFAPPSTRFLLHASSTAAYAFTVLLNQCSSTMLGQDLLICCLSIWLADQHAAWIKNISNNKLLGPSKATLQWCSTWEWSYGWKMVAGLGYCSRSCQHP